MFPAYSSGTSKAQPSRPTNIDRDGEVLTAQDARDKNTRLWNVAHRKVEEEERAAQEIKESMVIRRTAFFGGDSDDSDEGGGMSVPLPEQFHRSADEIFKVVNPNLKRKAAEIERKQEIEKGTRQANPDNRFPIRGSVYLKNELVTLSSDDDDRKKKKRKKEKKKKHRKRRSSSSSSSSSSATSSAPSRNSRKLQVPMIKWSHLTTQEYGSIHDLSFHTWMITSRKYDPQNYSLGFPVAEKIVYRGRVGAVLGRENEKMHDLFPDENTLKKKVREKPFYVKLLQAAKHAPGETRFRKLDWDTISERGFVKLSKESLTSMEYDEEQMEKRRLQEEIRKDLHQKNIIDAHDSVINAISDLETRGQLLNSRLSHEPNNIELWLSLIDLQDQIYESKKSYEVNDPKHAFLERKEEILKKAIEKNRRIVLFPLMRIDVLILMQTPTGDVLSELKKVAHSFPHEPLAWNRYLDYIQFNNNVYTHDRMESAFSQCLEKVRGLVEGTLQSHIQFIENMSEFRRYQLDVYVRYLKWLLSAGFVPKVIANIQATLELNMGFDEDIRQKMLNFRLGELKSFWNMRIARIGDIDAMGASSEMIRYAEMSEEMKKQVEYGEYDLSMYYMKRLVEKSLERCDRSMAENWVEFEREAMNVDARVKRKTLDTYVDEIMEEIEIFNLWAPIEWEDLKIYAHPQGEKSIDFIQPLLELLGARFLLTNGCYSTTEEMIENWRPFGVFQAENVLNFPKTPTHAENFCMEFCIRVIHFLLKKVYKYNPNQISDNERVYQLFSAAILTKAKMMERQNNDLIKKLSAKKLSELLKESIEAFNEMLEENANLRVPLQLIAVEKFVEWHQIARENLEAEQLEIERCLKRQIDTDLYVDKEDVRKVQMKIPKAVFKFLLNCNPNNEVENPICKFPENFKLIDAQIQLFSLFLNIRMITREHRDSINMLLAAQFVNRPIEKIDRNTIVEEVKDAILKFRLKCMEREYQEENRVFQMTSIEILPKPSVICIGLLVVHAFTNLKIGQGDIAIVSGLSNLIIDHIAKGCEKPTAEWFPFNNGNQARDAKFLLDTFIYYLSETKERKCIYSQYYRNMIQRAQQYMPCDASYAKRYLDEIITSTVQKINVEKSLFGVKNELKMMARKRFDSRFERTRLMVSIASIYCQLRLSSRISDATSSSSSYSSLLKRCRQEASDMSDAALWRVAISIAAQSKNESMLDEMHVMATGQVAWARNVHIDWVAGAPTENRMDSAMMLLMEVSKNAPHILFVDDTDILKTHYEVAEQRRRVHDMEMD